MPEVSIHKPEGLSARFERGAFRSLKSLARITYTVDELNAVNPLGPTTLRGPYILHDAVQQLINLGHVPFTTMLRTNVPGQATNVNEPPGGGPVGNTNEPFSNLVLVGMDPKISASQNVVDVELTYEHVMDGYNQILINPPSKRLYFRSRSSIVEKSTNFFHPNGNAAIPRQLIRVGHTYQDENLAAGIPNAPIDPSLPKTVVWTGTINVPFPQHTLSIQGMIFTDDITLNIKNLLGKVNEDTFFGHPPRTWICSEFSAEMHNGFLMASVQGGKKGAYKVSLEFQFNFDTWDATAVFVDQRTGRPPADILDPVEYDGFGVKRLAHNPINGAFQPAGVWLVPSLGELNYHSFFGGSVANPMLFEKVGV